MQDEFDDEPRRRPDDETAEKSGSGVKIVVLIVGSVVILAFCVVVSLVGLIVYGVREASKTITKSMAQFETQIRYDAVTRAMTAYEAKNGHFPPPAMKTRDGKPGLSWRVAILPQLGRDDLYKQFKIDQPWNDPENMRLAGQIPYEFLPPNMTAGQNTHLRLFVGKGAMFEFGKKTVSGVPKGPDEIGVTDGLSNTILIVEATQAVLWIQPDELLFDPKGPLPALGMAGNDYFYLATADGFGRPQAKLMKPQNLRAAITANGGELVSWE
jgi:Protein of unknown function (DUF1559)